MQATGFSQGDCVRAEMEPSRGHVNGGAASVEMSPLPAAPATADAARQHSGGGNGGSRERELLLPSPHALAAASIVGIALLAVFALNTLGAFQHFAYRR